MTEMAMGAAVDLTDATERARALVLAHTDAPFRQLADHLPVGVFLLDGDHEFLYANRLLMELTGLDPEASTRSMGVGVIHPEDRDRVVAVVRRVFVRPEARVIDCRLLAAGGVVRAVRCRLAPVVDEHDEVIGLIGTVADHTDVERQLEHRATHDELTELPNRVLLAAQLDAALDRASIHRSAVAVLFVGLQRVGVVADALGHAAGDRLVRQASRRVVAAVGPDALVSRFAEDRFVIVMEDIVGVTAAATLACAGRRGHGAGLRRRRRRGVHRRGRRHRHRRGRERGQHRRPARVRRRRRHGRGRSRPTPASRSSTSRCAPRSRSAALSS